MSASIVNNQAIQIIVEGLASLERELHGYYMTEDDKAEMGQQLVNANYESINYRYKTSESPHKYRPVDGLQWDDGILIDKMLTQSGHTVPWGYPEE